MVPGSDDQFVIVWNKQTLHFESEQFLTCHSKNLQTGKVCFSRAITMKSYNMFYLFSITPTTLNRISLSSRVDT
ncbi:hypothetical protein YC2023_100538 [Brassica napus]